LPLAQKDIELMLLKHRDERLKKQNKTKGN